MMVPENIGFIQLGENIYLNGFNSLDNASMIILKKIIGSHVKRINETKEFDKIEISTVLNEDEYEITIDFCINSSDKESYSSKEKNLFICVDDAFKKI